MIQKTGDYYVFEDADPLEINNYNIDSKSQISTLTLQATGNIKQKIQAIRDRFNQIQKQQTQLQLIKQKQIPSSIFSKINDSVNQYPQTVDLELNIPDEILKLDSKLSKIEQKLRPNEIMRRKVENKETLVQRISLLQGKLKSVLQKSSQIIVTNIQNYCAALDDKDDYLKIIFLREAHSKVKGMKEEIQVLQNYFANLQQIQTKIKAIEPIQKSVCTHSELVKLNTNLSIRINKLFNHMKSTYLQLLQEIDSLPL